MTSMAAQLSLGIIAISSKCEFNMSQADMGIMMAASVIGKLKQKKQSVIVQF